MRSVKHIFRSNSKDYFSDRTINIPYCSLHSLWQVQLGRGMENKKLEENEEMYACFFFLLLLLNNIMEKMGATHMFNEDKADFTGTARGGPDNAYVSHVIHKAFVSDV